MTGGYSPLARREQEPEYRWSSSLARDQINFEASATVVSVLHEKLSSEKKHPRKREREVSEMLF